jgi:hypothetical protein
VKPRARLTLLALSVASASCTGTIVPAGSKTPVNTTTSTPDASLAVDPAEGTAGPSPVRRLTGPEYLNTLADLFPQVHESLPQLPADTIVGGFENAAVGQSASDVLIARYEAIARQYAQALTLDDDAVASLTGCADWSTVALANACANTFFTRLGLRLFRRPLSHDERTRALARFSTWREAIDFQGAITLSLEAFLQSPAFLYRVELPADAPAGFTVLVEPYAMASRLSYFLWLSAPDDQLLQAAAAGELTTPEQLRQQAARMLDDPRAKRTFYSFHRQWLNLERVLQVEHATRTPEVDPWWSTGTQTATLAETRRFIEQVTAEPGSTLADVLLSRRAWVDPETARIYGVEAPDAGEVRELLLPEAERAGVLTRAAFLAGTSHPGATSPPIRGNQLFVRLLCQEPRPPPDNVNATPPAQNDGGPQTNRQLFVERTQPASCQGCHARLNGLGFGFEHYSASGAFQALDQGLPVDTSGQLINTDVDGPFDGALELSRALAKSAQVERCAASMWVRYAVGRELEAGEQPTVDRLAQRFSRQHGELRSLLLEVVASPSFRLSRVDP